MNAVARPTPDDDRLQPALDRCPLFYRFSLEELQAVLHRVELESFPAGADILTENLFRQAVWVVLRGRSAVNKSGGQQQSTQLAVLEPGNIFGEMSFLQLKPASATIHALTAVETLCLTREHYDELLQECPGAAQKLVVNIVDVLAERLRLMDSWTCELVNQQQDGGRKEEWADFRAKLYTSLFD